MLTTAGRISSSSVTRTKVAGPATRRGRQMDEAAMKQHEPTGFTAGCTSTAQLAVLAEDSS